MSSPSRRTRPRWKWSRPPEKDDDEEETEEAADGEEEAVDTGPDPEEAATRFASIAKVHGQVLGSIAKLGAKDSRPCACARSCRTSSWSCAWRRACSTR